MVLLVYFQSDWMYLCININTMLSKGYNFNLVSNALNVPNVL